LIVLNPEDPESIIQYGDVFPEKTNPGKRQEPFCPTRQRTRRKGKSQNESTKAELISFPAVGRLKIAARQI
jgi:hypothetical protein